MRPIPIHPILSSATGLSPPKTVQSFACLYPYLIELSKTYRNRLHNTECAVIMPSSTDVSVERLTMSRQAAKTSANRVTLKDVAKVAGVHTSTVSRALDPNSRVPLTDEVSARIRKAAKDLGYQPNRIASGLRTNRSLSIGVLISDITNSMFPPIIRGIESVFEPLGYASILYNTDNRVDREKRLLESLWQHGVDGIICATAHREDRGITRTIDRGIPVVTLNRRLDHSPVPYVVNDEEGGINLALRHLFQLGHRRIGHISGPDEVSTGIIRSRAFTSGCMALGLHGSNGMIATAHRYEQDEGKRCATELLTAHPDITALVCANDQLAIGAYSGLGSIGRSVPGDISVTGFNDIPFLNLIPPRLTTVRIRQFEAGCTAAEFLLDMIRGERQEPVGTILPVELMVRDSTAAPPVNHAYRVQHNSP